jgi:uncharacterized tellurite resistance protein B-like protein
MILLLPIVLLVAAGIFIAHKFSPVSGARKRATKAVATLQTLDTELRSQYQDIQNSISQAATSFIQEVRAGRLRSIPLDELKKHEGGLRLQALKDSGIRTLADIQGWNENRISQVRGVGPKSASSIARLVYQLSSASNALPIPSPTPPFALDRERILLQAIYRDCWFEIHLSPQRKELDKTTRLFEERLSQVVVTTTFSRWLWSFGANDTVRNGIAAAETICSDLEGDGSAAKLRGEISTVLATCRNVCSNRVESELVLTDYRARKPFYEWALAKHLGNSGRLGERPAMATLATTSPNKDGGVVHFEFGGVSSGAAPVLQTPSEIPPNSLSPAKRMADEERLDIPEQPKTSFDNGLHVEVSNAALPKAIEKPISQSLGRSDDATIESLTPLRVGAAQPSAPAQFILPSNTRPRTSKRVRWVKTGESITVQGIHITKGLFYFDDKRPGGEQWAIDPNLQVKRSDQSSEESPGYYYSYIGLTPAQRFLYLKWLSEGALSNDDPGFGVLYLGGLERRIIRALAGHETFSSPEEREDLLSEISRLANLFQGTRGSVTHSARRLLEFIKAYGLSGSTLPQLPELWERGYELPPSLLYGLGYLIQAKEPIPLDWALRWAYLEPTFYLRTPATRCRSEYEAAFAYVYKERYETGLVIPPNKTILKINYQPMSYSSGLTGIECKFTGIPDVRALTAPQQALREIVEQSTAMVDSYSRFLGRNASKAGSLEACLTLPLVLWPENAKQRLQEIQTTIAEKLQPVPYKEFLQQLGCEEELSSGRTAELVKSLSNVYLGFEPDVLAGAKRPRPSDTVVLFTLSTSDDTDRTTPTYKKASLTIALAATVALADGHASDLEMEAVDQMILRWGHLHLDLRARLRAQYRFQVHQPSSLASLKTRLTSLTTEDRTDLALSMSALANVDGVVSPEEVKLLEQVYRTLELEPQTLYSHLHGGGARQRQPAPLSSPSVTSANSSAFLDAKRIIELRQETDAVTELLAGVFVEEETNTLAPEETVEMPEEDKALAFGTRLPGLDMAHDKFLALLLTNSMWSRADLLRAASESQIMLDGALERNNEAALDFSGEVLIEGDDPLYVQHSALENAQ